MVESVSEGMLESVYGGVSEDVLCQRVCQNGHFDGAPKGMSRHVTSRTTSTGPMR